MKCLHFVNEKIENWAQFCLLWSHFTFIIIQNQNPLPFWLGYWHPEHTHGSHLLHTKDTFTLLFSRRPQISLFQYDFNILSCLMIITEPPIREIDVTEVLIEQHLPVTINTDIINTYIYWKTVSVKQITNTEKKK